MDLHPVIEQLKADEGLRLLPYECTAGRLTIGYGRNLEDVGITKAEAEYLLANDVESVTRHLSQNATYRGLDEIRQGVLINMAFNLGQTRLAGFKKMWAALRKRDYSKAADEMLDSLWARQVGHRASRLAKEMRTGERA